MLQDKNKLPIPPTVTIVITNYNYSSFLPKAIDSALAQKFKNIEIIVVDDASTDNSLEVLSTYKDMVSLFVHQENAGQAAAFNTGVKSSDGDIICFLDADDSLHENKVDEIIKKFKSGPWGMVFNDLEVIDPSNQGRNLRFSKIHGKPPPEGIYFPTIIKERYSACFVPTSAISITREVADVIFPLNTQGWEICADNQLSFAAACIAPVGYIDKALGTYLIHGSNQYAPSSAARSEKNEARSIVNRMLCHLKHMDLSEKTSIELFSPLNNYKFALNYFFITGSLSPLEFLKLLNKGYQYFRRSNKDQSLMSFFNRGCRDLLVYFYLILHLPCQRRKVRDYYFANMHHTFKDLLTADHDGNQQI